MTFATESLLSGPPRAGTSRLARQLTTLVPAMTLAEALETTRIHCVAALTGDGTSVAMTRPCRAPHQTISDVGLIGGGPLPGRARGHGRTTAGSPLANGAGFKRHRRQDSDRPSWAWPVVACADGGECSRASLAGRDGTCDLRIGARAAHTRMPQARRPLLQTVVNRTRRMRGAPLHV